MKMTFFYAFRVFGWFLIIFNNFQKQSPHKMSISKDIIVGDATRKRQMTIMITTLVILAVGFSNYFLGYVKVME